MGRSCRGGSYASVLRSRILLVKSMERVGRQLPHVLCCLEVPRHHDVRLELTLVIVCYAQ